VKTLTLRTLGECAIQVGDATVSPTAPHLFALLLFLGVERCRDVPRATLIEVLFPDDSASSATHNLRQLLYRVRKLGLDLGGSVSTVRLDGAAVVDVVNRRLDRPYHESAKSPGSSCELLPGYQPPTPRFSQWLECYRDGVHRALVRKLAEELQTARRGANWSTVESFASSLLTLDPFNETATLCMAESLARTGSKQRAVTMLQRFEEEVGSPTSGLALPSRLLKRRISESTLDERGDSAEAPLVGRTREMEVLSDQWSRARAGRCTVVTLTGEKSIGKSRLTSEFLSIVRLDASGSVVFSRRRAADGGRPFSLFADICKQLIGMPGAAGCSPNGLSFLSRLTTAPDGFESLRAEQSEVQFTLGNVRRAIIELIECVAHERPLILAIDDSRFLDDASRAVLRDVQNEIAGSRLLILAVGEVDDTAWSETQLIRLSALDQVALTEVANYAVARHQWPIDDELRRWCVEMASGNPGYLELLLQSVRSTSARQLPRGLIALVDDRIGALSPHARQALQAIALLGAACNGKLIEELCGLGRAELLDALQELEGSSMILAGPEGVACRSVLIEECTRAATPKSVALVLHARAAKHLAMEARRREPTQAMAWRIAAHWHGAGLLDRARYWQRTCWRQSVAIGQPRVAAMDINKALADATTSIERAALLDDLAGALFAAGDLLGVDRALRERRNICSELKEGHAIRERIRFDQVEVSVLSGDNPTPLQHSLRQMMESRHLDVPRRIRSARTLMIAADHEVDRDLATDVFRANHNFAPTDVPSALLHGQTNLIFHSVFGDYESARQQIAVLQRLVESASPCWAALTTRSNLVLANELVSVDTVDLSDLEQAFYECQAAEMNQMAISVAGRIGCCLIDQGEIAEATKIVSAAQSLLGRPGTERLSMNYISCCVDLAIVKHKFEEARAHIESFRTYSPAHATGGIRNYLKIYELRWAQLVSKKPMSDVDLEWLLMRHDRMRSFGRHDDSVELLWIALSNAGRPDEASQMLNEYLIHWRRERRGSSYLLRLRTESDPVWDRVQLLACGGYAELKPNSDAKTA
jgi:DNA-binding SARP family transcriptional activator